jgi:hypothetical protein
MTRREDDPALNFVWHQQAAARMNQQATKIEIKRRCTHKREQYAGIDSSATSLSIECQFR